MNTSPNNPIISLSLHSKTRICQRGICPEAVLKVIQEGEIIHKQGLKFHFIPKRKSKDWSPLDRDLVKDLIVITNLFRDEVVTCYKNPKAIHQIKKKPKRLLK
jgi:hypothetical protein